MYERISGGSDVSVGLALKLEEDEEPPPPPGSKEEVLAIDEAMLGWMYALVRMRGSKCKEGSGGAGLMLAREG